MHHTIYDIFNLLHKMLQARSQHSNYKSHIKQKVKLCSVVKNSIDSSTDTINPSKYLKFISIDSVTNTQNRTKKEIYDLLLGKENFWIGTLISVKSENFFITAVFFSFLFIIIINFIMVVFIVIIFVLLLLFLAFQIFIITLLA